MFQRSIQKELRTWRASPARKPLIIRGARQVGKTTAVRMFSEEFRQFLSFNLEKKEDRDVFEQDLPFEKLVQAVFFLRNKNAKESSTLIFIDEIQNSPKAIACLRFFADERPDLAVIAAGSLLEVVIDRYTVSFPVGRVEFMYLFPASFEEYLGVFGNESVNEAYKTVPVPDYAHETLLSLFHEYTLIGGMPEVIGRYGEAKDLNALVPVYESLLTSYIDDAAKYSSRSLFHVLRHTIESAPLEAGKRIRFQGFGNSAYRSREMGEALRILERAMLLYLIHPVTSHEFPLVPDKKKSPRLQFLDTGLMNHAARLQSSMIGVKDLNSLYRGRIAEHIVGQELTARKIRSITPPLFWVREKSGAQAELDFVHPYKDRLVPVEVKSGKSGTLRSLHEFIKASRSPIAVRLYSGRIRTSRLAAPEGIRYTLLDLPYYLAGKLDAYLDSTAQ